MNKFLVIRADASMQIGTGHVMRCLALAQTWQDAGGEVLFVLVSSVPALDTRLKAERLDVVHLASEAGSADEAKQTLALASSRGAVWMVADGYQFGAQYQRAIKQAGLRLLFVDDYGHASPYSADVILNQNIYADQSLYFERAPDTHLMLGTSYALLRREFWPWCGRRHDTPALARKVLVTLGGGDPDNVTLKVIRAMQQIEIDELEAIVVIGYGNPHLETLAAEVRNAKSNVRLVSQAENMPEIMAWADVAISAGGTTNWELASMGVPNLVVVLADNQRAIAAGLARAGVAIDLGWFKHISDKQIAKALESLLLAEEQRFNMSELGQRLVDGKGALRVRRHLMGAVFRLRRVLETDCHLLWDWANEPAVRASALSSKPIPWDEHVEWFHGKLQDPNCLMFIALDDHDTPVGQIRFDVENHQAAVDVSIEKRRRGAGYGSQIIRIATDEIFRTTGVRAVHAFVKSDNQESIGAFEKANFRRLWVETVRSHIGIHLIKRKTLDECGTDT